MKTEVTLWDLPEDKVYVKIKEPFKSEFFKLIKKRFGGAKNLSKLLDIRIDNSYIYNWKRDIRFCPLKTINRFISILEKNEQRKFRKLFEKNIEAIKAPSKGTPIFDIKFPIKLSVPLSRIAGHLVGDGGIASTGEDKYRAYYINQCDNLINEFINDMRTVFGDVKIKVYIDKTWGTRKIKLPRIFGIVLSAFFGLQSNEYKHIPECIMDSNKKFKATFIRALFDDEGNVDKNGRKMTIGMTNKKIIEGVKEVLLKDFNIKTNKIRKEDRKGNRKTFYIFHITDQNNFVKFYNEICFTHPIKEYNLRYLVNNYRPYFRKGEFEVKVLDLLKDDNMTALEISNNLNRCLRRTKQVLCGLEKQRSIKSVVLKQNLKLYGGVNL